MGDYRVYNDYFARLSKLLSESCSEADILLLHPIKSAWVLYNGNDSAPVQELDSQVPGADRPPACPPVRFPLRR